MSEKNAILKEMLIGLNIDIRLACFTHCWRDWRDIDYVPDYNKLYYIVDGEGWLKIGESEIYPKSGQMVLMPAGVLQSYSAISDTPFSKYWCHFVAKIGDVNLFSIIHSGYCIDVADTEKMKGLFETLINSNSSEALPDQLRARSALLEILAFFLENAEWSISEKHGSGWDKIAPVIKYIENHISEDISLRYLAEMAHLHPNYFIRFFKAQTGMSPIQYINKIRLDRAKELLIFSGYNVTEAARQTGFNDIVHFSKLFKSHTGFSPSEFKKINSRR